MRHTNTTDPEPEWWKKQVFIRKLLSGQSSVLESIRVASLSLHSDMLTCAERKSRKSLGRKAAYKLGILNRCRAAKLDARCYSKERRKV